jgi:hypothetical protein
MNDNNFWLWIDRISNIAQLESYQILLEDFNNTDLMNYLQHQDELLNTIIDQNQQIINLLEGGK